MAASTNDLLKKTGSNTVTTLSAPGKALGATSINVGSTTNYPADTGIIIAIRQVDSSGALVAGTYTEWSATVSSATSLAIVATPVLGSDQIYAAGSTTQVYIPVSSYAQNKLIDNILEHANQDGSLITQAVRDALNLDSGSSDGWTPFGYSLTSITALGNRSYTAVVSGTDTTGVTSVGMRLKLPRTVTAPTQCADLESGSSQYFSKTSPAGLSFTDDFTCTAWVKLESYTRGGIIARRNGDTEGWSLAINASGQILFEGLRIAANNVSAVSYQSIPLNKWVHVAGSMDMSGTSTLLYIDGVLVPSATTVTGTATALVQGTTALVVGAEKSAGTNPFDGKIAQAAVYSAVLSAATIRAAMNQTLTGSETSLVSAYTFNNSINDLSANANNLTAQGSAVATNPDTPFTNPVTGTSVTAGTTNYGIIMAQTFSTNTTYTIQIPEGETLPTTGGIGTVSYSTQKTPYGFPGETGKWVVETVRLASETVSIGATNTWFGSNFKLNVPVGKWKRGYVAQVNQSSNVSGVRRYYINLSDVSPTNAVYNQLLSVYYEETGTTDDHLHANIFDPNYSVTTATDNVFYSAIVTSTGTETVIISARAVSRIYAENAYL